MVKSWNKTKTKKHSIRWQKLKYRGQAISWAYYMYKRRQIMLEYFCKRCMGHPTTMKLTGSFAKKKRIFIISLGFVNTSYHLYHLFTLYFVGRWGEMIEISVTYINRWLWRNPLLWNFKKFYVSQKLQLITKINILI